MNAATNKSPRQWFALISLIFTLLLGTAVVSAQSTPTPITTGQNQAGTLADAPVRYSLRIETAQSVTIQVFAITPAFAPAFVVLDPGGALVLDAGNPGSLSIVQGSANFFTPGDYAIEISSASATGGQFLISVQAGEPLVPTINPGENKYGTISAASSSFRYSFSIGTPLTIKVQVLAVTPGFAAGFRVLGADDSVLIDVANSNGLNIATGNVDLLSAGSYIIEVRSANATTGQYVISLQQVTFLPTSTPPLIPTATGTADPSGPCMATPTDAPVNIRSGPGTNYDSVSILPVSASANVNGKLADGSWLRLNVGNPSSWVSAAVVTLSGSCDALPVVEILVPLTQVATPMETPMPSSTPDWGAQTATALYTTPTPAPSSTATPGGTTGGVRDHLADLGSVINPGNDLQPMDTRPDLVIYGVQLAQTPNSADNPYHLSFAIGNRGEGRASGPITIRLCIRETCLTPTAVGSIGAGGTTGYGLPLGPQFTGQTVTYTLTVDYLDAVSETDESNNVVTGTLTFED